MKDFPAEPSEPKNGGKHQSKSTFCEISPNPNYTLTGHNPLFFQMWFVFKSYIQINVVRFQSRKNYNDCTFIARKCDLNVPCCLFHALHCCLVGVLRAQKAPERILHRQASPGLASPSLKLTTSAPSATHHWAVWGWYAFFCFLIISRYKKVLFLPPKTQPFFVACTLYRVYSNFVVEWAVIQNKNRINETHTGSWQSIDKHLHGSCDAWWSNTNLKFPYQ